MAPKWYELTVLRNGRPAQVDPILAELDFDDRYRDQTKAALTAHLRGAARRLYVRDQDIHEITLSVRETWDGKGTGKPFTTFALPEGS
jgi:hypothetical protein